MIIELLIIATIVCYVIDISGFIDSTKIFIWWLVFKNEKPFNNFNLKPFDCSLCMTFWIGLIYIIINDFSLINLFYVCILSFLSSTITYTLNIFKDLIIFILNKLSRIYDR